MTTEQLARHARQKALDNGIELREISLMNPKAAFASVKPHNVVECAPIDSEVHYAIAMHEIGHHCSKLGRFMMQGRTNVMRRGTVGDLVIMEVISSVLELAEEEWAWAWAIANSPMWTPTMESIKRYSMESYLKNGGYHIDEKVIKQLLE